MKHYVYKIEEKFTGEFYIGVRSCRCDIKDDPYMGSMTTWKPNKSNLTKEIIGTFDTRKEANAYEQKMIMMFFDKKVHPLNRNYAVGHENFCTQGQPAWNKGKPLSPDHKASVKRGMSNVKYSDSTLDTRRKNAAKMAKQVWSDDATRELLCKILKNNGYKVGGSLEGRKRMRDLGKQSGKINGVKYGANNLRKANIEKWLCPDGHVSTLVHYRKYCSNRNLNPALAVKIENNQ